MTTFIHHNPFLIQAISFWEESWAFIAFLVTHKKDAAIDSTACYDPTPYMLLSEILMCSLGNQPFLEHLHSHIVDAIHQRALLPMPCMGHFRGLSIPPKCVMWAWFHVLVTIAGWHTTTTAVERERGKAAIIRTASMEVILSHGSPSLANRAKELPLLIKTCALTLSPSLEPNCI